ncbi:DUF5682 family protein [Polyangium aurulentum]|uniref:DUF5682 family protein n=1 Tax=Polyangium aurulentum TaxID=2567896 RepID=UPI0010AE0EB2|nr:DUF5682 family protein [Polyangium aurulentum]UQA59086.1 hypothetical protein E8A73_000790 [Polyangium aurulentum]
MTAPDRSADAEAVGREVSERLGLDTDLAFFPVRHHSPTCAAKLEAFLDAHAPDAILIEGPARFDEHIGALLDPESRPPFAFVAVTGEAPARWVANRSEAPRAGVAPVRAYYPFCDYSPELVAMRAGAKLGAEVRFVDLLSPPAVDEGGEGEAGELARALGERLGGPDDGPLARSRYTTELCRRAGCRDFDELWEALFEQGGWDLTPAGWAQAVGTYALLSRQNYRTEELWSDGTLARERFMAAKIAEVARRKRRVAVVLGAFHAVALGGARDELRGTPSVPPPRDEAEVYLVPYTFPRLDALFGYAPGMSGPAFYQRVWDARALPDPFARAAEEVLLETIRLARAEGDVLGPADAIAALAFARELSALRGRPRVGRVEVVEAATSCFVKGEGALAGRRVLAALAEAMRGTRVGSLGRRAGQSAIAADFHGAARALKLPVAHGRPRPVRLDLERGALARRRSRFFHRCAWLGIGFCKRLEGPDVESGEGPAGAVERWTVQYVPEIDARLAELSPSGASVEEAASEALARMIAGAEGRAGEIAAHAARAILMGLEPLLGRLVPALARALGADGDPISLLAAAGKLRRLSAWRARIGDAPGVRLEGLAREAYEEGARRLGHLAAGETARGVGTVPALLSDLADAILAGGPAAPSRELVIAAARGEGREAARGASPLVLGAIDGLLLALGGAGADELAEGLASTRGLAEGPGAYLEGVLSLAPRALVSGGALLEALVGYATTSPFDAFLASLPSLRRALARLGPREAETAAARAAALLGLGAQGAGEALEVLTVSPEVAARLMAWERRWLEQEASWAGPAGALPDDDDLSG